MVESSSITLPDKIFFCGVPGSRWSSIARELKNSGDYNLSDRASHRGYKHHGSQGHLESYFGTGMEFPCDLSEDNLLAPFTEPTKCKLLLSHEWAYNLEEIVLKYPDDWIMLIYRENWASFLWWKKAGGFKITYPNYGWYESDYLMTKRIEEQNDLILTFAQSHNLSWKQHPKHKDIFITTYKYD